jgi:hypothetical protein
MAHPAGIDARNYELTRKRKEEELVVHALPVSD